MQKLANHLFKTTCWLRGGAFDFAHRDIWFEHEIWNFITNEAIAVCSYASLSPSTCIVRICTSEIWFLLPQDSQYLVEARINIFFRQRHGNRKSIIVASVYGWRQFFDFMPDQKGKWGIQYCLARANTKWGAILHTVFCAEILQDRKCGMILLRL